MAKFDINPGDLIEWTYSYNNKLVVKYETLWSTIENKFVPIGSEMIHACVACDSIAYAWYNKKGLFRARFSDTPYRPHSKSRIELLGYRVIPRERKT